MVPNANQVRTSLTIAAAGAVLVGVALLTPRREVVVVGVAPEASASEMILTARTSSTRILPTSEDRDIAVTITAPGEQLRVRPPLSLAIVIDRSGSMHGERLTNAKAAAEQIVDTLDDADAFTIVTYSTSEAIVVPIGHASSATKAIARDAIEHISDFGGTCMSCGITRSAGELARTPVVGGVRRMIVISDGRANLGTWHRDDLSQLVAETAAHGVSISTVGVGLDFDEVTMTRLADVGHGQYYFVENTSDLGSMFAREIADLSETVAVDVHLVVRDGAHAHIEEAYGYPMTRDGDQVIIPIADLRAGETRKVVLRTSTSELARGAELLASFELSWQRLQLTDDVSSVHGKTSTALVVEVVDDPRAVAASVDRAVVRMIEEARAARAIENATATYERSGYSAAQQVIQLQTAAVRANVDLAPVDRAAIESATAQAIDGFATAPAAGAEGTKAGKLARKTAHEMSH